jgi:hypothetical protein
MNFIGTGVRLTPDDFSRASRRIGCSEAAVRAVVAVEARGTGWDARNRPVILFEPHIFWRNLSEPAIFQGRRILRTTSKRERAEQQGLAWEGWKPGRYPPTQDDRYRQLDKAIAIDETAALQSASWGIAQVLGDNHAAAGFATVQEMVTDALVSEGHQLNHMIGFIIARGLGQYLRALGTATDQEGRLAAAAAFALRYNGPAFKRNKYDVKIVRAFIQESAHLPVEANPLADGVLSEGDKGAAVLAMQTALFGLGYPVTPDGDFGKLTKQAVVAYQRKSKLKADGKVGPMTGRSLGLSFW